MSKYQQTSKRTLPQKTTVEKIEDELISEFNTSPGNDLSDISNASLEDKFLSYLNLKFSNPSFQVQHHFQVVILENKSYWCSKYLQYVHTVQKQSDRDWLVLYSNDRVLCHAWDLWLPEEINLLNSKTLAQVKTLVKRFVESEGLSDYERYFLSTLANPEHTEIVKGILYIK